jgi:hypothetical protein
MANYELKNKNLQKHDIIVVLIQDTCCDAVRCLITCAKVFGQGSAAS